jgi:hypothetical protein
MVVVLFVSCYRSRYESPIGVELRLRWSSGDEEQTVGWLTTMRWVGNGVRARNDEIYGWLRSFGYDGSGAEMSRMGKHGSLVAISSNADPVKGYMQFPSNSIYDFS